jgi:hypothetical protein
VIEISSPCPCTSKKYKIFEDRAGCLFAEYPSDKGARRHASCFAVAMGLQEFVAGRSAIGKTDDRLKMNGEAGNQLAKFVPWTCLVAVVLTVVIFFASGPTSHTRRALCMAFASIYADQCSP